MKTITLNRIVTIFAILVAVLYLFSIDFNSYAKNQIVNYLENLFGAKIEVASANVSLKNMFVEIKNLKIGDRKNKFLNLAGIDDISFKLKFKPLLSKKFVIDKLYVSGIKFHTLRKTSSKISMKNKISAFEDKNKFLKKLKEVEINAEKTVDSLPNIHVFVELQEKANSFSPHETLNVDWIECVNKIQDNYILLVSKMDTYYKIVNAINIEKQQKEMEDILIDIDKKKSDSSYLKLLNDKKNSIDETMENLKIFQTEINEHIAQYKASTKDITNEESLNLDVDNISGKILEQDFIFKNISEIIFKRYLLQKIEHVEYFMNIVKNVFAQNQILEDKNKGKSIRFPVKNGIPKTSISEIILSNITIGNTMPSSIALDGKITNAASDMAFASKPAEFIIKGNDENSNIKLSGFFNADKNNLLTVFLDIEGIPAKFLYPENTYYTPTLENFTAAIHSEFNLTDLDFTAQTQVTVKDFVSEAYHQKSLPDVVNMARNLWTSTNSIDIVFKIKTSKDAIIEESFTTNNDALLKQRFDAIISTTLGDIKEKIKREVVECFAIRKKDLDAEIEKYKTHIFSYIAIKQKIFADLSKNIDEILSV
ncbi:MAG: hypothetical protein LBU55_02295 [Elusimicrobiota bacterium]|jgi:uncharacterized protein (TIGR03545 family)|nr:hypothetical protein [Elusimicrobiota bacterium]